MKVRCVVDCFFQCRHFQVGGDPRQGVYDISLESGQKLPQDSKGNLFLVPIEEPKKPAKGKGKPAEDDVLS